LILVRLVPGRALARLSRQPQREERAREHDGDEQEDDDGRVDLAADRDTDHQPETETEQQNSVTSREPSAGRTHVSSPPRGTGAWSRSYTRRARIPRISAQRFPPAVAPGFEPGRELPPYTLSRRAPSSARASHRGKV